MASAMVTAATISPPGQSTTISATLHSSRFFTVRREPQEEQFESQWFPHF
jgi:hypothetical protein